MAETLSFDIVGRDRLSDALDKMSRATERLNAKLERLDKKVVTPEVKVDVDKPLRKVNKFADSSSGIMAGAMKIVSANAILMGGAVAAALAALPAVAAVAGTGIVLGMGGALGAIGIIAAAQNKKVKKEFTDLKDHVVEQAKEMAAPFRSTLMTVADVARNLFDSLGPELERAFQKTAPALSQFARDLGAALNELGPTLTPMAEAFNAILEELGPRLEPLIRSISGALISLAGTVEENADEFVAFIDLLLSSIPAAIRFVDSMSQKFIELKGWFTEIANHPLVQFTLEFLKDAFGRLKGALSEFAPELKALRDGLLTIGGAAVLGAIGLLIDALGLLIRVVGNVARAMPTIGIAFTGAIIAMLSMTKTWVNNTLDGIAVILVAMAGIPGPIGDMAANALEGFERFRAGVNRKFNQAISKVGDWNTSLRNARKVLRLRGDIRDLKAKIDNAKRRLKDPDLTRPERTRIRARIDQLQQKVRDAKAAIASVKGKTVHIRTVRTFETAFLGPRGVSGFQQMQHGGPVQRNRPFLVGEAGPELFVPNQNGRIVANDDLQSSGGAGLGAARVVLEIRTGQSEFDELIATSLQRSARKNPGLQVQVVRA